MLIKSLVLGAVLVSTPFCLIDVQDPGATTGPVPARSAPAQKQQRETQDALQRVQRDLDEARRMAADLKRQVGELLDIAEQGYTATNERQHGQNCNPGATRNRALLSHYQWLERNQHAERAERALQTLVEQHGNQPQRLAHTARELMLGQETAGKFDRVALALVQRIEKEQPDLQTDRRQLDTMALAHFLNGDIDRAITLQQAATEQQGHDGDGMRRLRTYQAAKVALAAAQAKTQAPAVAATGTVAASHDE